jgi:hypothetical protein
MKAHGSVRAGCMRCHRLGVMGDTFHLLDLPSQALAVQRLLAGRTAEEKLAWLAARGQLTRALARDPRFPPTFRFVSFIGMECVFFLHGDELVFVGDNTTYTARGQDRD